VYRCAAPLATGLRRKGCEAVEKREKRAKYAKGIERKGVSVYYLVDVSKLDGSLGLVREIVDRSSHDLSYYLCKRNA
jgi:hypothetical protein